MHFLVAAREGSQPQPAVLGGDLLHDINHALQYADEIVVIKDHGVFAQGTPKEVLTVDMLGNVFGVRADVFVNSKGISVLSPVSLVK